MVLLARRVSSLFFDSSILVPGGPRSSFAVRVAAQRTVLLVGRSFFASQRLVDVHGGPSCASNCPLTPTGGRLTLQRSSIRKEGPLDAKTMGARRRRTFSDFDGPPWSLAGLFRVQRTFEQKEVSFESPPDVSTRSSGVRGDSSDVRAVDGCVKTLPAFHRSRRASVRVGWAVSL